MIEAAHDQTLETEVHYPLYTNTSKSHQLVATVQMKNWEPLVLGPALAMLMTPAHAHDRWMIVRQHDMEVDKYTDSSMI